jgi:hypothetical protein
MAYTSKQKGQKGQKEVTVPSDFEPTASLSHRKEQKEQKEQKET